MPGGGRKKTLAAGAFALLLLACGAAVALAMEMRYQALQELEERQQLLSRLEVRSRAGGASRRDSPTAAPQGAFLAASTQGLAAAALQAYLSRLVAEHQATLVSSAVQQLSHDDTADTIRLQATITTTPEALQSLLYRLESGAPYVFVDQLSVMVGAAMRGAENPPLRANLGLRAIWRKVDA